MREPEEEKLFFIDTNIFLRVFIKEDEAIFNQCLALLKLISERKIKAFISTIIVLEVNFVLTSLYKFEKERVVTALQSIVNLPFLKIIDDYRLQEAICLVA